ncbi:hypothetical protein ACWEN6_14060 [Sphaerisporangium sp. NPDC004334]
MSRPKIVPMSEVTWPEQERLRPSNMGEPDSVRYAYDHPQEDPDGEHDHQ